MSKNALCLTSLVAAIPGAWLAVLMVMAFVNHAGGPTGTIKGLAGALLLVGGTLAAMPVGIFLFTGPKTEKPPKKKAESEKPAKAAKADDEFVAVADDESSASDASVADAATFEVDTDPRDSEEFMETVITPVEAGSDDFDLGADFELDDAEEAEPPKKKKK